MNKSESLLKKGFSYLVLTFSLLITGMGIGWFVGLSASPVASIIITSLTGATASLVAAASGMTKLARSNVNPLPLAILISGLVVGTIYGIESRAYNRFAQDIEDEVQRWRNAGLELDEEVIVRRIFDHQYAIGEAGGPGFEPIRSGVLSSTASDACAQLSRQNGERLRQLLLVSPVESWRTLPAIIEDDIALLRIVEEVICLKNTSD